MFKPALLSVLGRSRGGFLGNGSLVRGAPLRCINSRVIKTELNPDIELPPSPDEMFGGAVDQEICQRLLNVTSDEKQFFKKSYRSIINKAKDVIGSDFTRFNKRIREETAVDDPVLHSVCNHYFDRRGKQFRPIILLVISRILNEMSLENRKDSLNSNDQFRSHARSAHHDHVEIATISELIHVSSLMHDDVIDGSSLRRMIASTNYKFGNKLSILGGDLLFSRASVCLSKIGSCKVVGIISSIIQSLVEGEVLQMQSANGTNALLSMSNRKLNIESVDFSDDKELNDIFNIYLERLYLKTASLLCKSALAAAAISGTPPHITDSVLSYARNVGLAFQIYDDISDFDSPVFTIGKPVGSDLKNGLATLPVLFASKSNKKLISFMHRGFSEPNDVDITIETVNSSGSIEQSKEFALQYCEKARKAISLFPDIPETNVLREFTYAVQHRT